MIRDRPSRGESVEMNAVKTPLLPLLAACLLPLMIWVTDVAAREEKTAGSELLAVYVGDKYGFIRSDGTFAIPPRFSEVSSFNGNGLAAAKLDSKSGYIRTDGSFAIPPRFDSVSPSFDDEGLAVVCEVKKCGYIRGNGSYAIPPKFDRAYPFGGRGLALVFQGNRYGYIRTDGSFAIPPQFENANGFDSTSGLAGFFENGKWGYIHEDGSVAILPQFDEVYPFDKTGFALAKQGNRFGFIRTDGSFAILPRFEETWGWGFDHVTGLAGVKVNGKWGLIRTDGSFAVRPQFDKFYGFGDDGALAPVKVGDKWGFIRSDGTLAISPKFDDVDAVSFGPSTLAGVAIGDKWGYISRDGAFAISPRFRGANPFGKSGLAQVRLAQARFYINKAGETVMSIEERRCPDSDNLIEVAVSHGKITWPKSPEGACSDLVRAQQQEKVKKQQKLAAFRGNIKPEIDTNCGPVLEAKGSLVKVYFPVRDYGNEHWIKRDQLFPPDYGCKFVNGKYEPPN